MAKGKNMRGVAFGVAVVSLLLGGAAHAAVYDTSAASNAKFLADFAALKGVVKLPDGLMYRVVEAGNGTSPISRYDMVTVEYEGWMINGKIFDRTKPDQPRVFQTGALIPGWREAMLKMKTGDDWQIVIPADLAYGDTGVEGVVPPDQTLVFRVQLEKVEYAP
jgi:FKBP-type peptidyl-prolyl cis-trans isomerase